MFLDLFKSLFSFSLSKLMNSLLLLVFLSLDYPDDESCFEWLELVWTWFISIWSLRESLPKLNSFELVESIGPGMGALFN